MSYLLKINAFLVLLIACIQVYTTIGLLWTIIFAVANMINIRMYRLC